MSLPRTRFDGRENAVFIASNPASLDFSRAASSRAAKTAGLICLSPRSFKMLLATSVVQKERVRQGIQMPHIYGGLGGVL